MTRDKPAATCRRETCFTRLKALALSQLDSRCAYLLKLTKINFWQALKPRAGEEIPLHQTYAGLA